MGIFLNEKYQKIENNNTLSKKIIILGTISFWLIGYIIITLFLFLQLKFGVVWPKDTFFTLFIRPFSISLFSYIFYLVPLLIVAFKPTRIIFPAILSIIISLPLLWIALLANADGNSELLMAVLAGFPTQLIICILFSYIASKEKEGILKKISYFSLVLLLAVFIFIGISANIAYGAKPVLEKLSQEALEVKNASLCQKILDESKRRKVDDYIYNCDDFCKSYYDRCVENVAVALGDETLCSVGTESVKAECRKKVLLKTTDLCKDVSEEKKIECLQQIAIETNDIELCKKILGGNQCFGAIAVKTNNFGLCSEDKIKAMGYLLWWDNSNFSSINCFREVFRHINNPDICEGVNKYDKYECFIGAAIQLNNSELCERLRGQGDEKACLDYYSRSK